MLKFKEFSALLEGLVLEAASVPDNAVKYSKAIKDEFRSKFKSQYPNNVDLDPRPYELLRSDFGPDDTAENEIRKFFKSLNIEIENVIYHAKGTIRYKKDLASDDYATFEIITKDGKVYYITNRNSEGIGKKDLTPDKLGLNGVYRNPIAFSTEVGRKIQAEPTIEGPIKSFLIFLTKKTLETKFAQRYDDMKNFFMTKTHKETIEFPGYNYDFSDVVLRNITNDFGEVLDAIYLSAIIKNFEYGVSFPEGSNEALSDIKCDGWNISSKADKGGGLPGIDALVQLCKAYVDEEKKEGSPTPKDDEGNLLNMLVRLAENDMRSGRKLKTVETYTLLAQKFYSDSVLGNDSAFQFLIDASKILKKPFTITAEKPITREEILELIETLAKDGKWENFASEYLTLTKTKTKHGIPDSSTVLKKPSEHIGIIMYPLAKEVVEVLNDHYRDEMITIVNKVLELKQMYLKIDLKNDSMTFEAVSSGTISNVKFAAGGSTNTFNSGLKFGMERK